MQVNNFFLFDEVKGTKAEFPHLQPTTTSKISQDNHIIKNDLTHIIVFMKTPRNFNGVPIVSLDV